MDEATFWESVYRKGRSDTECWPWLRGTRDGYGMARFDGKQQSAHRVAYQLTHGPIPDGLVVDHVAARGCRMRACCNPAHLEAVTHRENARRARRVA